MKIPSLFGALFFLASCIDSSQSNQSIDLSKSDSIFQRDTLFSTYYYDQVLNDSFFKDPKNQGYEFLISKSECYFHIAFDTIDSKLKSVNLYTYNADVSSFNELLSLYTDKYSVPHKNVKFIKNFISETEAVGIKRLYWESAKPEAIPRFEINEYENVNATNCNNLYGDFKPRSGLGLSFAIGIQREGNSDEVPEYIKDYRTGFEYYIFKVNKSTGIGYKVPLEPILKTSSFNKEETIYEWLKGKNRIQLILEKLTAIGKDEMFHIVIKYSRISNSGTRQNGENIQKVDLSTKNQNDI
ncbi:MAG: hypothetical protein PSX81_02810 [bacterium]|nr:hypothetical protein [bacterium]